MSTAPGPIPFAGYGTGDQEYRRITLALTLTVIVSAIALLVRRTRSLVEGQR